jgi:hypothetical protein
VFTHLVFVATLLNIPTLSSENSLYVFKEEPNVLIEISSQEINVNTITSLLRGGSTNSNLNIDLQ